MLGNWLILFAATSLALPLSIIIGRQSSDIPLLSGFVVNDPFQPAEEGSDTKCISFTGELLDPSICIGGIPE